MKLLLEADKKVESQSDIEDLFKQSRNPREKFNLIDKWIKLQKNSSNIENAKNTIETSILETDSFAPSENPFINFINRVNWDLTDKHAKLIKALIDNETIDTQDDWIYNKNLYEGDINDSLFKIKAFAFINNKRIANRFGDSESISIKDFYNEDGSLKTTEEFKNILKNFQTKTPELSKKFRARNTQSNILKSTQDTVIKDPRIIEASGILKKVGLNNKEISKALDTVKLLPDDTSESYIGKLFKSLGR